MGVLAGVLNLAARNLGAARIQSGVEPPHSERRLDELLTPSPLRSVHFDPEPDSDFDVEKSCV